MKNLLLEWKNIYDKNIHYRIQIYFDWINIYFDSMKKGDMIKIFLTEHKFTLAE